MYVQLLGRLATGNFTENFNSNMKLVQQLATKLSHNNKNLILFKYPVPTEQPNNKILQRSLLVQCSYLKLQGSVTLFLLQ